MDVFGVNLIQLLENTFNFLLLTALLTIFAYRPVIAMLKKRKEMIEKTVADAQKIEQEKMHMQQEYKKVIHDANEQSKQIVEQALTQSQVIAKQISDDAKKEAEAMLAKTTEEIAKQKQAIKSELASEFSVLIAKTLHEVLLDSLSEHDQQVLVQKTLDSLKS